MTTDPTVRARDLVATTIDAHALLPGGGMTVIGSDLMPTDRVAAAIVARLADAGLLIAAYPDGHAGSLTGDLLTDMAAYAGRMRDQRDRALATLNRVRELHRPYGDIGMGYRSDGSYGELSPVCSTCGTPDEYATPFPCATIRALDDQEDS